MEKIINIKEIIEGEKYYDRMSGYAITTDKQVIKLLIDDYGQCCERCGYFMSEDNIESFIGANLIDVIITDTALNTVKLDEHGITDKWFEGGVMFVNYQQIKVLYSLSLTTNIMDIMDMMRELFQSN